MSEIERQSLKTSSIIEGLLFASSEPVSINQLSLTLNISVSEIEVSLRELQSDLRSRGIRLQWNGGGVQLTSAPEISEPVERLLGLELISKLSRAALETLAIIAYQQPVTRPYIEGVRGVSSDGVMKSLIGRGLICELGRTESPGRPILYGTTTDFLRYFGISSLQELPPLDISEANSKDED